MATRTKALLAALVSSAVFPFCAAQAATRTAASCSQTDVAAAISAASPGDTVIVPAGSSCSWSGGLSISGISLIGAGKGTSGGTVVTGGTLTMTKHASQYTRASGFRFTGTDSHISVGGNPTAKPYIVDNCYFFTNGGSHVLQLTVNGGVLHHNDFAASTGTSADPFSIVTSEDWSQAATYGTLDSTGERNIYFEDNTFTNMLEAAPDGDAGSRLVIRNNTYYDSSITFHGGAPNDSSPRGGARQFEIYNNTFHRVSNSYPMNKWVWVRGSSGVIANNTMDRADSPDGFSYANKSEIRLTLACPNAYPMQYQAGQSNPSPENPPSHPLLIFGNTGAGASDGNFVTVGSSDTAGGSCATPQNYIQVNRDYYLSNRWGWTPYTYPHPLASGSPAPPPTGPTSDSTPPSTPSNLSATASSSSQINLSWGASTDNVAVTGYQVERCQGSSCTNFAQVATPTGTSYNDTGLSASTTYQFRVRATDAAGNLSSYSGIASATTSAASQSTGGAPPALPSGNNGIAALHPNDANIASDPNVLFADDFESYTSASQLTSKWNSYYQSGNTRIATETGNVYAGNRALEFTLPASSVEVSNAVVKNISPTQDQLFVRVYTKFDSTYHITTNSNHNGITISAQYPGPGTVPNGTDFFLAILQNAKNYAEADPGYSHIYIYQPEQRSQWGDSWYPDGKIIPYDQTPGDFGPYFVPRPNFIPQLGKWYCYELMLKANTPGQRDGRIAFWIDGNLMADFQNVRLRDVSTLKIDQIQLQLHAQAGGSSQPNKKWYDNLVVAKSYIGPMATGAPATDPPTGLTATVR